MAEDGLRLPETSIKIDARIQKLFQNGIDSTPERFKNELIKLGFELPTISVKRMAALTHWARSGASLKKLELLHLRPPRPQEAAEFHRQAGPDSLSLQLLAKRADIVTCTASFARLISPRHGYALLIRKVGHTVYLEAYRHSLRHAEDRMDMREWVEEVARDLQVSTPGYYVFAGEKIRRDFEPLQCLACHRECFTWQDNCQSCGFRLDTSPKAVKRAQMIVQQLYQEEALLLGEEQTIEKLAFALAPAAEKPQPAIILEALLELEQVEEVFGEDDQLTQSIKTALSDYRKAARSLAQK